MAWNRTLLRRGVRAAAFLLCFIATGCGAPTRTPRLDGLLRTEVDPERRLRDLQSLGPVAAHPEPEAYAVYGYGAHVAEVDVDMELGTVKVVRLVCAHDVGRAINPVLATGQVEGGAAQGLGLALMEEYVPGRTENLHDYLIPTVGDMPTIETILVEKPDPEGPFGAKGLGEHALIPTAPAILNAIRHASGAALDQVPALPHRVLAAIKAARTAAGRLE